jgi:hypothetical protein
MPATLQSYANHRRFFPLFHFFVLPILAINVIVRGVRLVQVPSLETMWATVLAVALTALALAARMMSLRLQDRLIRLEEQTRLARLAPADGPTLATTLRTSQLIGLRFASDREVVPLAQRCASGELKTGDQVKRAVTEWRPDYLRV